MNNGFILERELDRVVIRYKDSEKGIAVKLVWSRPVSGRGNELSILDEKGKELEMLSGLESLDEDSAAVAIEELDKRYLIPKITHVRRASAHFGNRYMDVETDRGPRTLLIKDPNANVIWFTDDRLIIRDTLGNRYEILSLAKLSAFARAEVDKII